MLQKWRSEAAKSQEFGEGEQSTKLGKMLSGVSLGSIPSGASREEQENDGSESGMNVSRQNSTASAKSLKNQKSSESFLSGDTPDSATLPNM